MIPFNKPYLTSTEIAYVTNVISNRYISGNGSYTKACQAYFERTYGFSKCLLTSSCTDALEMAAILLDFKPGDEVIVPSYTFVSTANAFILRGANVIFADSHASHPNIDETKIEELITNKTKAIVVVHYGGVPCEMDTIMLLAKKYNLYVVEDAAHSVSGFYKNKPLGGIGHLGVFSFHETKNIQCGEGGLLVVNDKQFEKRSEIIWEKGTNRSSFSRGEVKKYEWIDVGSSFLPSELNAAYLLAQLENIEKITQERKRVCERYDKQLSSLVQSGTIKVASELGGHHLFYMLVETLEVRSALINYLNKNGINAIFHYLPLHLSPFHLKTSPKLSLPCSEHIANTLVRLPCFVELTDSQVDLISQTVKTFFKQYKPVLDVSEEVNA